MNGVADKFVDVETVDELYSVTTVESLPSTTGEPTPESNIIDDDLYSYNNVGSTESKSTPESDLIDIDLYSCNDVGRIETKSNIAKNKPMEMSVQTCDLSRNDASIQTSLMSPCTSTSSPKKAKRVTEKEKNKTVTSDASMQTDPETNTVLPGSYYNMAIQVIQNTHIPIMVTHPNNNQIQGVLLPLRSNNQKEDVMENINLNEQFSNILSEMFYKSLDNDTDNQQSSDELYSLLIEMANQNPEQSSESIHLTANDISEKLSTLCESSDAHLKNQTPNKSELFSSPVKMKQSYPSPKNKVIKIKNSKRLITTKLRSKRKLLENTFTEEKQIKVIKLDDTSDIKSMHDKQTGISNEDAMFHDLQSVLDEPILHLPNLKDPSNYSPTPTTFFSPVLVSPVFSPSKFLSSPGVSSPNGYMFLSSPVRSPGLQSILFDKNSPSNIFQEE